MFSRLRQPGARAIDAALDGADRAAADFGRLLVGEAGCADQDQRLALVVGQLGERGAEFLELDVAGLLRLRLQRLGVAAVGILDLAAALAILRAEQVAQDGEQPRRHVGARLERMDVGERAQQRLLHQIVGAVDIAAQRNGERAQARHRREHLIAEGGVEAHSDASLSGLSSCCRRSANRSGVGSTSAS